MEGELLHYHALKIRVPRGERFPITPSDVIRRWANTPGVEAVSEETTFHYDAKTVEIRSFIRVFS